MLPSVVGALLSTVVLVYVLSNAAYTRHKRFIAGARSLRQAIVAVYAVLLVLNLWCATIMPVTLVCDAIAVATEYHRVKDVSGLGVERNLFRYRPVPVAIRLSEGSSLPELLRVMAAATVARSPFTVSAPAALPKRMLGLLREREIEVTVESDAHWLSRVRARRITATCQCRPRPIPRSPRCRPPSLSGCGPSPGSRPTLRRCSSAAMKICVPACLLAASERTPL